jgi:hypothetical protein
LVDDLAPERGAADATAPLDKDEAILFKLARIVDPQIGKRATTAPGVFDHPDALSGIALKEISVDSTHFRQASFASRFACRFASLAPFEVVNRSQHEFGFDRALFHFLLVEYCAGLRKYPIDELKQTCKQSR